MIIYLILSAIIICIDQFVKYWTVQNILLGDSRPLIDGFISLTHLRNTGAAWSILEGKMFFLVLFTALALAVVIYCMWKNRKASHWLMLGLSLILAGGIGNLIDRIRLGYVVDMFQTDFMNFPIFNVADMSLVVGVVCVFIYIILDEKEKK
ncbi:MAG: signal peptidase II [Enterococcus sp.]